MCSSAEAISLTWRSSKLPKLPKHRKTTEEGGCLSNQLMIVVVLGSPFRFTMGQTGYTGGDLPSAARESSARGSNSLNVFMRIPG